MENQHRKIKGYRELSQHEIDLMNQIKEKGLELAELVTAVKAHHEAQRMKVSDRLRVAGDGCREELDRLNECEPERWCSIGRTHFQEGLMALTRSVAQPGFF